MGKAWIGTMGWSYEHWVGNFYPSGATSGDLLTEYAKHFDNVEVNSTFYRVPYKSTVEDWKEKTPEGFIFAAKIPRAVTHGVELGDDWEKMEVFIENISLLGDKLGPLLIQLPPKYKPDRVENLGDFLASLPRGHRYAVEFRDRGWLDASVYERLEEYGVALVLVDHPWIPEAEVVTADFTYIRWQGDRKLVGGESGKVERDRSSDNERWAERIAKFLDESINVYGYFSKFYSGHPPTDAKLLLECLTSP